MLFQTILAYTITQVIRVVTAITGAIVAKLIVKTVSLRVLMTFVG